MHAVFHAAVGCFPVQLQHVDVFFFPLEIHKHHTGQQMQIIPEPSWLSWWVTAISAETPLTTCVLLLCCRHQFSVPSTHVWLMHIFFILLSYPAHLFVVSSCVQSFRKITGMFQLLHSTFQQRFQVGSNLSNRCRFHCTSLHAHSSPNQSVFPMDLLYRNRASVLLTLSTVLQEFNFLFQYVGKILLGPLSFFCNTIPGHLRKSATTAVALCVVLQVFPVVPFLFLFGLARSVIYSAVAPVGFQWHCSSMKLA